MNDRDNKRNLNPKNEDAIIELMHHLNQFCFHKSGADDNCNGCPCNDCTPCPLNTLHEKLGEALLKK